MEHRPASNLAGDSYGPAVGFDNRLADGESHAGALHAVALVPASVEFVEDKSLLEAVNTWTAIGHAGDEKSAGHFAADKDRSAGGGELRRVIEELRQNFPDTSRVHRDRGQAFRQANIDGMIRQDIFRSLERCIDHLPDGMGFDLELDLTGVEAGHLERFLDQVIQVVTLLVDDREKLPPLGVTQFGLRQETRDRSFDRREWGSKLMRNRIQKGGAESFFLPGGLGLP